MEKKKVKLANGVTLNEHKLLKELKRIELNVFQISIRFS